MQSYLDAADVTVHFCEGDIDHNRTVTAFSGPAEQVKKVLTGLCEIALPAIDLNRHIGVHPRIGGLDVCPFVLLEGDQQEALAFVEAFGQELAVRYELPVFLYEQSERGIHAQDLPTLRKGGFGLLLATELHPDFGPSKANPLLGASVVGLREFLIAMNVNINTADPDFVESVAKRMRKERNSGNPIFKGVRALGFTLASRKITQVSLNFTKPDETSIDQVVQWVSNECRRVGLRVRETELIGVIRPRDLLTATCLHVKDSQIVSILA